MLGDLHIHSKYSSHALYSNDKRVRDELVKIYPKEDLYDETPTILQKLLIDGTSHIENIMVIARRRGLKVISVTDHNTLLGTKEAMKLADKYGLIVVPGMELSTQSGEVLAYGISEKIKKGLTLKRAISKIHEQGGIAVVAHPFNPKYGSIDYQRIDEEIFKKADIDGMEVFNPIKGLVDPHFLNLARQMKVGITGGSDAHLHYQIAKGLTIIPDECITWKDVIKAIKKKETYVTGLRINSLRVGLDYLWCNTLGRFFISRKWGVEGNKYDE